MKTSKNDIGRAFNKAFDDYKVEPDADLWAKIEKENITPSTITPVLSSAKFAASMAVIIGITVITYFILSLGINQVVVKNKTPETIVAPIRYLPTETIIKKKEIISTKVIDSGSIIQQKNIANKEIVNNVISVKSGNSNKESIPLNNNIPKGENIITPIKSNIINIEDEIIEPEVKLVQHIIPIETRFFIEPENNVTKSIDSLKVMFGGNKIVCFGEDAILEVEDGYTYRWSNGGIGNKVKVSPTENSNYYVTVSNEKGQECVHTYTVDIDRTCSALFIPSAFTPNGDGQNDFFKAEGEGLISIRMYVYDKNSNKVFEANNIDDTWDGTYKGVHQGAGMFFYVAEYIDAMGNSHVKKGQVTIIK